MELIKLKRRELGGEWARRWRMRQLSQPECCGRAHLRPVLPYAARFLDREGFDQANRQHSSKSVPFPEGSGCRRMGESRASLSRRPEEESRFRPAQRTRSEPNRLPAARRKEERRSHLVVHARDQEFSKINQRL